MSNQLNDRTADQAMVREINLSLILHRLFERPLISRAALATMTGLNKSTVSSLILELLANDLVREVGLSSNHVGRPSTLLELNPNAGYTVSAEIGVDFISVLCSHFGREAIWWHREQTRDLKSQQAILSRTLDLLHEAVTRGQSIYPSDRQMLGLSIGVPGLVDRTTGTILFAPNLEWKNVPLRALLQQEFPAVAIFVENEANMAALGETIFGAAKGHRHVLFISAGVGLGGGVVLDSQLYKGHAGFASEFGHMTVEPDGLICKCGNRGCWETVASQAAVFRAIRATVAAGQNSVLVAMTHNNLDLLSVPLVVEAAQLNDSVALLALEKVGRSLGIGMANLVNAYNPDLILFGGVLSSASAILFPTIEAELKRRALPWNRESSRLVAAQHGSEACVIGGIALIYHNILSHPTSFVSRRGNLTTAY